ncbi:MAG: PAS domain-containing protein, partial [Pirellulaceae bacterium]|nr:PAS domain-containing protein [Pirellulaceae bacterium]
MSEKLEPQYHDRDRFDPMVGRVVRQFVLIALVVVVTTLLDLPAAIVVLSTGLVLLALGLIEIAHRRRRWRQAEAQLRRVDEQSRNWRRRLDALLYESQQSTMALSKMIDGVVMLSPELRILLMNKAAQDLFALPSGGDYLDRIFSEVVRVPEINQAVRSAQAGDGCQEVTVEIHDQSSTTPVRLRVDRVADRDDSNVLLTIRDETEVHRVEAMRREFVANFSHEIKTPIAAIKGYGETAELAIDDDPTAATHFLRQIQGQCLRLERLVADMM